MPPHSPHTAVLTGTVTAADIVAAHKPYDPFDTVNPERNRALLAALRPQ